MFLHVLLCLCLGSWPPSRSPSSTIPSKSPTSDEPSNFPSHSPTSEEPTVFPTHFPSHFPSLPPTTETPSVSPSAFPTIDCTVFNISTCITQPSCGYSSALSRCNNCGAEKDQASCHMVNDTIPHFSTCLFDVKAGCSWQAKPNDNSSFHCVGSCREWPGMVILAPFMVIKMLPVFSKAELSKFLEYITSPHPHPTRIFNNYW